ncbi:MAG TPA: hypothetical protein VHY31_24585 [Streptosporangiaceae bacterium]|nr:hypothetical protein [Streptosporangiaceae bacterium]
MTIAAIRSAGLAVEADTRRGVLRGLADPADPARLSYMREEVSVRVGGPGAAMIALAENATRARVAGSAAAGSGGAGLAGAGSVVTVVGVTRGRPAEVVIRLAR